VAGDTDGFDLVQEVIGYRFVDMELLTTALTHSSYASENGVESYERLEFLGDAVLELAITAEIHRVLGSASEGRMTRVRAAVVDEATLAGVARSIGLPSAIKLGVGEDRSGGRDLASIQSDVIESILGAVYVDGGADASFDVVHRLLGDTITDRMTASQVSDSRSSLQEHLARKGQVVSFDYGRSGPDHDAVYTATATVDGEVVGTGTGGSKKSAAIDAARAALASDL
jgi:ribonuclease-3